MQTATLAFLLHRRSNVSLSGLDYNELLRSIIAGITSYAALTMLRHYASANTLAHELILLLVATLLWAGISALVLELTGSALIRQLAFKIVR